MLASIFSKSRPINYVLIGVALVLFYFLYLFKDTAWLESYKLIGLKLGLLLLLGGSLLVTGFVTLKNTLTRASSYALVLFLLFLVLFPTTLTNSNIIVANFF